MPARAAPTVEAEVSHDDVFWESVAGCTDAVEVEMYLAEFPQGRHVGEAQACLKRLGVADKSDIEALLELCEVHFEANRLTTGVGGTAMACYEEVLSRDPGNRRALEGLERVMQRYADWGHAARAGTTKPFHFGSTISTEQANYDGNYTYGSGRKGRSRKKTVPVGSFPANRFGLHDVHGNVWGWVQDCGNESYHGYHGAPRDGSAWERGDCSRRIFRGGFWFDLPGLLRSALRNGAFTGSRHSKYGFRIARTLTP